MIKKKGSRIVYYCSMCKSEIPRVYYEDNTCKYLKYSMIGYPGHGKSSYLISLLSTLKYLSKLDEDLIIETLDDDSHASFYHKTQDLINGKLPAPSSAVYPRPAFFKLSGFNHSKTHFISFFDTGGKLFENLELMTKKGRFFTHSDVIFFFISLTDDNMKDVWNLKIMKLLDRYINVVYSRYGTNTSKKQKIIFVLSKADELAKLEEKSELLQQLNNEMANKKIDNYLDSKQEILNQVNQTSNRIEDWLRENNCNSFINFARDHFKEVLFSMVSVYGSTTNSDNKQMNLLPTQHWAVLEPFIWALSTSS